MTMPAGMSPPAFVTRGIRTLDQLDAMHGVPMEAARLQDYTPSWLISGAIREKESLLGYSLAKSVIKNRTEKRVNIPNNIDNYQSKILSWQKEAQDLEQQQPWDAWTLKMYQELSRSKDIERQMRHGGFLDMAYEGSMAGSIDEEAVEEQAPVEEEEAALDDYEMVAPKRRR